MTTKRSHEVAWMFATAAWFCIGIGIGMEWQTWRACSMTCKWQGQTAEIGVARCVFDFGAPRFNGTNWFPLREERPHGDR